MHKHLPDGIEYEVLSDSVFKAVSDTQTPQGILTVVSMPEWNETEVLVKENGCYLILREHYKTPVIWAPCYEPERVQGSQQSLPIRRQ